MKPASWSRRFGAGTLMAAGTAGSMLMLSAVAPASATSGPTNAKVAVPQGVSAAALKGYSVFPVKGSTPETVSFVLKERDVANLKGRVSGGMRGGFLSVHSFANRYGQTHTNISRLQKYLKGFGIKSSVYADGLDVVSTGKAWQFNRALSVSQGQFSRAAVPAHGNHPARPAVSFHGTTDKPLLPKDIASYVDAILGLTNYPVESSNSVHTPLTRTVKGMHAVQLGNRKPSSFASQYGLKPLYAKGAKGQGETIGIITFASVLPSDATHFWSKVLKIRTKANRIRLDNVDGGSGKVSAARGSGETTLDVEQSGGVAPQANIVVYQAPNTDYGSADAFFTAASQNVAATVSSSWGESEILNQAIAANSTEAATYNGIFDEALLEMAAQGQSTFDASGDSGAYDDAGDTDPSGNSTPYTGLSVDNPADSPWITSGGGTTEAGQQEFVNSSNVVVATINITAQRAWGWDYLYPFWDLFVNSSNTPYANEAEFAQDPFNAGGGGGGYSVSEGRPSYQQKIANIGNYSAVPYLTAPDCPTAATPGCTAFPGTVTTLRPQGFILPTVWSAWAAASTNGPPPAVVTGSAGGRVVPDLSADADPDTGYLLYFTKSGGPALQAGWGGTSFVAPQLNGSAAVIDSYLHHRAGFWNPEIYKFAAHSYTPFTPLSSASANNDNLFYTGTPGTFYNPATGLGVPNLNKLALDFKYHH